MMRVSVPEGGRLRGAGQSILIVEDSRSLAHILADALAQEGFDVTVCASASEALALCRELGPDAISVRMRCGSDVLSLLAQDPCARDIPIVAIGARPEADQVKCVLPEPFYVNDVVNAVFTALDR
jgi:CheY-like chemotaxis protein